MANVIRIKRRVSGVAGAPASLASAEMAHNEVDDTLYIGKGDNGSGVATSVVAVGGKGAFVDKSTTQTVAGAKTFSTVPKSSQDASGSTDLVRKSQFDSALSGKSETGHGHAISDTTGLQTALDGKSDTGHGHAISDTTGLQTALDAKAPTASPALTGTPTAPTPSGADNSTKIATTAFVQAKVAALGAGDMAAATYDPANISQQVVGETATQTLTNKTLTEPVLVLANSAAPTPTTEGQVEWDSAANKLKIGDGSGTKTFSDDTANASAYAAASHGHAISDTTGLQAALDAKAPTASPALTGTPTAPTAAGGTNTLQIATTAFVQAAVGALIDGAPGAIDTLNELAAALGDDPAFATTVTNSLAGKLAIASNLSDLNDAGAARSNLGLGSMAVQAANSVAITGGTIDGVSLDGGTF